MPTNTRHAFISYSRKDTPFVERLEAALNARGISTWRDATSIPGGDDWYQNIVTGLTNAYAVICIVTPNADESKWVRREQLRADEDGIPPLVVQPAKHRNPLHLQEVQPILMDAPNWNAGVLALIAALERCQTRHPAPTTATPSPAAINEAAVVQEYLKWVLSDAKADLRDALYVELEATPEHPPEMQAKSALAFGLDDDFDFSTLGIEHLRHDDFAKAGDDVPDARIAIRELRRAVLLGEPGAGKTTTLLKITVDLARAAQTDPKAKLPIYIPLREFDGSTAFAEFVRAKTHNLQAAFDRFRDRFMLLCDALNEMPRNAKTDGRDLMAEVRETLRDETDWVVSCRVRDYTDDLSGLPGIGKIRLKPLDPPRMHQFIQRKYADQPQQGIALWRDLRGSDDLLKAWAAFVAHGAPEGFWGNQWLPKNPYSWNDEGRAWQRLHADHRRLLLLCRSPFLANMVCVLYRRVDKLPDNRAGLYAGFVANLLRSEEKRRAEVGLPWLGEAPIRVALGQIAWALGAQTEMPRAEAEGLLGDRLADHKVAEVLSAAAAAGLIDYGSAVRFTHQLLQQYFAAAVLGTFMDAKTDPGTLWRAENWWESTGREETAILLAGDRNDPQGVARWLAPAQPHLALELLSQPDFALDLENLAGDTRSALIAGARAKTSEVHPVGRAAAYRVLGRLRADHRRGIGLREDELPDLEWVEIPAGEFHYGHEDERDHPPQRLKLPRFSMTRYLVTYEQFSAFLAAADGFSNPVWWEGLAADDAHKAQPGDQAFKYGNHPRERVSWYDAIAFTRWLSAKLGYAVMLPTEQQYERAARWTDGRLYPYAGEYDSAKANTRDTGIGQTNAVGIFPQGASVEGIHDLSGNVFEWCLNEYSKPENIQIGGSEIRVLRGGSWNDTQDYACAVYRNSDHPVEHDFNLGFRLVAVGAPHP